MQIQRNLCAANSRNGEQRSYLFWRSTKEHLDYTDNVCLISVAQEQKTREKRRKLQKKGRERGKVKEREKKCEKKKSNNEKPAFHLSFSKKKEKKTVCVKPAQKNI